MNWISFVVAVLSFTIELRAKCLLFCHQLFSKKKKIYNLQFALAELASALQTCGDSSGPDEIYYSLLKRLPDVHLNMVLKVFNHIWFRVFHSLHLRLLLNFTLLGLLKKKNFFSGVLCV